MQHLIGTIYLVIGVIGVAVSILVGLEAGSWLVFLYLFAATLGVLALAAILIALGDLVDISRKTLLLLSSRSSAAAQPEATSGPSACPKCGTVLTGQNRYGKCYWCAAKLPSEPRSADERGDMLAS